MNVGEIVYRILGDDTQFNSVMGKVGATASKALSAISKAALAVTGAAAAAVGTLAKEAVASFADYEQLAGGAKLMFGDAYDYIAEKAKTAFKDVQMSQNEYLEQVNGFAIGLKTALGGDELAAAKLADRIVTAEADIVAATGNTAENIQNAFNGIMKNNYTMLDNLQIGITPTKEGFQELIDKVNAYKEAQGEATNYTIDNLADCQNALVDYIEMQGLSGYAQAEGAETLSGSMASMKAAWQNMLTGMADPTQDFDELVSNLVDSVLNVSENLMPRIMAVLPQMATGITELAGELLPLIPETLNAMLPGVLEGANNLVSALLDTISSIADTAIPIITENADEIIDTLLTGLVDAVPKLVTKAADLCTALITAILDNADIITQGAVDVVVALANGISENLDTLVPAAVRAVLTIVDTLLDGDNIDNILNAAENLIISLTKGLIDSIPLIMEKAPEIVIQLADALIRSTEALVSAAVSFCTVIADELVHHDWSATAETTLNNLADALDNAQKHVMLGIDDLLGGNVYGGDINNVHSTDMVGYMRDGIDDTVKIIEDGQNTVADAYDKGMQEINSKFGQAAADKTGEEWLKAEEEREANARAVLDREKKRAEEWKAAQIAAENDIQSANSGEAAGVTTRAETLEAALADLENKYAVHQLTEEEYWSGRKAALEKYRNEEDAEWWKLYDKVTEHYDKLADTEEKAADKVKKEAESKLKESVENKFRELETEQLQKGYDDSWLLEQERAFLETLDHNSETYKDYNLKLLKEQKSYDDKAAKEAETAAKKQRDAVEKSYDSIVKSRDSLAKSLSSGGDIFSSSEETDKRTGAKKKSSGFDTSEYERKLAAKKKLTSKIAELYEKDAPDSLIRSLLKKDPEDALTAANQLLRDSKKLSEIKSMFKEDETVNNTLANIVTENSEDFKALGEEAGNVFGEGFMSAFRDNWEGAFQTVFGDEEYTANASVKVNAANSSAAETTNVRRDYSASENSGTNKAAKASGTASQSTYKIIDLNGRYVATVVNNENARSARTGGR